MTKTLFPLVSADVALFSIGDGCLQVLLVQRAQAPAAGQWALQGAVLKPDIDRDLEATARRALRDKISVEVPYLEQLQTFAGADRDPRGWSLAGSTRRRRSITALAGLRPRRCTARYSS